LLDVPEEDAEPATKTDAEETWLMKRGRDVGQKAVSVFVQWAKREQELDNMTRMWEQALEMDSSDHEEASTWIEKQPSSHQPSSPTAGSIKAPPTTPAGKKPHGS